jgi:hypothetical protein
MRTNLNTIITTLGISFTMAIIATPSVNGQTWYDSEGRPLIIKGKKVIRKEIKEVESKKEPESVRSIIPKVLELRPELSNVKSRRAYPVFQPYLNRHFGYRGYYGPANHRSYQHHHQGCYKPRGVSGRNFYLNYRRSGFSIRARF